MEKERGVIAGETAIGLWDLADVNGRKIHLAVPPRYNPRARGGELYKVHRRALDAADIDEVHGVPTVTAAIALRQAIAHGLAGNLVDQAITQAHARELIGAETAARLRVALYDRNQGKRRPRGHPRERAKPPEQREPPPPIISEWPRTPMST